MQPTEAMGVVLTRNPRMHHPPFYIGLPTPPRILVFNDHEPFVLYIFKTVVKHVHAKKEVRREPPNLGCNASGHT